MKVYLDNAATTAVHPEVVAEMLPYFTELYGNASSVHSFGRPVRAAIERARKQVAEALNCSTAEIFFTSCGTESNNAAIKCAVKSRDIRHIITTPIEHHCVLYATEEAAKDSKIELHHVQVMENGEVDYDHLDQMLGLLKGEVLVSIMHANNEIGTLNDLDRIAKICKEHNALFHSDTVQTITHYPLDLQKTKVDFISGSAHKFHGPKGVGFMFIREGVQIRPFIHGGSQERNQRAGTENVAGIIGLAKALQMSMEQMKEEHEYITDLKQYMVAGLEESIPNVSFNTPLEENASLCRVLSVSFPPSDRNEMLLFNLDINGIAVSGGSACSSGSNVGSHVLAALGKPADRAAVRFSFCMDNTKEEIDFVVQKLAEVLKIPAKTTGTA